MSASIWNPGTTVGGDPGYGGMWPDVTSTTRIHRIRDRMFVGEGAAFTGNRYGTQGGFVPTSVEGANWAPRDSILFAASRRGLMAVTGYASNEDMDLTPGQPDETIGVSGIVKGKHAGRSCWAFYADVQYEGGISGWGIEIAVKNKSGVDTTATPYFNVSGACGIWLPAGSDDTYGGVPTHPNNYAIGIGTNSSTWNKGIIFFHNGLTRDGSGYATMIEAAEKHRIVWRTAGNNIGFDIRSEVTSSTGNVAIVANNSLVTLVGNAGANIFQVSHQSNAVNYFQALNSATNTPVQLSALGTDPDIDIRLFPKGSGNLVIAGVRSFANDAAAAAASPPVPLGGVYRNGSALQIRVT